MTWQQEALSAVYTAAADDMERRDYNHFQGGFDVWGRSGSASPPAR